MRLFTQLTAREEEILQLVAKGHENKAIANDLKLSVFTVQNHIQNMFERLGVHNRTEAASHYWQQTAHAGSGGLSPSIRQNDWD